MFVFVLLAGIVSARVFDLPGIPKGWEHVGPASPDETIQLRLALRQQGELALEAAVLERSDPGTANYGIHLSREELQSYTAPSECTETNVAQWLRAKNVTHSIEADWITLRTTVDVANDLFNASFGWFRREGTGAEKVNAARELKLRSLSYSIPDDLTQHVDTVQPVTRFGDVKAMGSAIATAVEFFNASSNSTVFVRGNCDSYETPGCLKQLLPGSFESETAHGRIGFASFLGQSARYGDLEEFIRELAPHSVGLNFSFTEINGGVHFDDHDTTPSMEANLDVAVIMGWVHPIPIHEYIVGGYGDQQATVDNSSTTGSNEPYLELLEYLLALNDTDLPTVLSISYGEEEQSVPEDYARKVCNLFMQLGARGVSVIFASGDYGPGDSCTTSNDTDESSTYFQPVFPATCPWVTAIGATANRDDMVGASFSSGGFSLYFDRPAYQDASVPAYVAGLGGVYAAYFNSSKRAFPDAATIGVNYAVVDQGGHYLVNGTSASAATFAGQVALLNAARLSSNLTALGFLNPLLYNHSASIFSDVTGGSSVGCVGNSAFGAQGASWNATDGWDPVTGLGVLNFTSLKAMVAPDATSDVGS
ncbi:subtilisin-like protein [Diaporthe eres]|nr:subtilisin-like protein [Diaporthe eres]